MLRRDAIGATVGVVCPIDRVQHGQADTRSLMGLAGRQHGQVRLAQARAHGFTDEMVAWRVRRGDWVRRHRGVLSIGPLWTREAEWMAAVLACAPQGLLSGGAAAELLGFGRSGAPTTVVVAFGAARGPMTVVTRRSRTLAAADAGVCRAIPVTSPARTLVDLARSAPPDELERALHDARRLRLIDERSVRAALDRAGPAQGVATLRVLLDDLTFGHTHEKLERLFAGMARRAGWAYRRNVPMVVCGRRIVADAFFEAARLIVELDGRASHEWTFVDDRDRDLDAAIEGILPVRLTKWHLTADAARTERRVSELLRVRSAAHSTADRTRDA